MICIFVTGGTFDKTYDEIRGQLSFGDTHLPEMLRLGRSRAARTSIASSTAFTRCSRASAMRMSSSATRFTSKRLAAYPSAAYDIM